MGLNFRLHQLKAHNPLNFIKFWVTLKAKGYEKMTQLEKLVWDAWEKNDFSWIPNGSSHHIQKMAGAAKRNEDLSSLGINLAQVLRNQCEIAEHFSQKESLVNNGFAQENHC
jgi:hypothetical protein